MIEKYRKYLYDLIEHHRKDIDVIIPDIISKKILENILIEQRVSEMHTLSIFVLDRVGVFSMKYDEFLEEIRKQRNDKINNILNDNNRIK